MGVRGFKGLKQAIKLEFKLSRFNKVCCVDLQCTLVLTLHRL